MSLTDKMSDSKTGVGVGVKHFPEFFACCQNLHTLGLIGLNLETIFEGFESFEKTNSLMTNIIWDQTCVIKIKKDIYNLLSSPFDILIKCIMLKDRKK